MNKLSDKVEPGDLVNIKTKNSEEIGILLESYEPGVILLKLESGYNIGIKREDIKKVVLIKKQEKREDIKKIKNSNKPKIDFILCGGTIASSLDTKTGGVKWITTPENFFRFYPEIFDIADINIINPFMKSSENMNLDDWLKIAKQVKKSLDNPEVKGVIITHGTDLLHYTGAALSFALREINKPVILTYSQRSIDRASSDASLNLYCSAKIALSDIAEIMLVGHANSSDNFCYALKASKVRKMHSSKRSAFKPINAKPIAKVYKNKIKVLGKYNKKDNKKIPILDIRFEEKIALIKFYPGQDPSILDYYANQGYKGIIIEVTGLGHLLTEGKNNWIPLIKKTIERGIYICAAPQTIYGSLNPFVYSPGRELKKAGVIFLKDMLSETAFVKLSYVLGHKEWSGNNQEVEEKMLENISGEINERLGKN